jgi:hypothetical protein
MDEQRFDDLARSSATAPRRRVLGAMFAATLGGFAVVNDDAKTLAACKGNSCHGKKQPCHNKKHCFCFKRIDGSQFCGSTDGICTICASDADCPEGAACITAGGRCCGQESSTACVAPCGEKIPLAGGAAGPRGFRVGP